MSYEGSVTLEEARSLFDEDDMGKEIVFCLNWSAERFVEKSLREYDATMKKPVGRGLTEEALRSHDGRSHSVPTTIGNDSAAPVFPPAAATGQALPRTRMHAREVATRMEHVPAMLAPDYPTVLKAPPDIAAPGILEYMVVIADHIDDASQEELEEGEIEEPPN